MNREILFRGKSKDTGEWLYGDLLEGHTDTAQIWYWEENYGHMNALVKPSTVGQYTGVTDKNGQKIFEGDIVEVDGENENAVIVYDSDTARFMIRWVGVVSDFDSYFGTECEIVGNIHDNPELLEG